MSKYRLVAFVLGLGLLSAVFVLTTSRVVTQSQDKNTRNDIPIVDFEPANPTPGREPTFRAIRGKKYETGLSLHKMKDRPGVMDDPPLGIIFPAFPIKPDTTIVRGVVTRSSAFLSSDKSAVYSEFDIFVNQVLRGDPNVPIEVGSRIVAERMGGKVRFGSGTILQRGQDGRRLPQVDAEYILFLDWDKDGEDFLIETGYEIVGGKIRPLDGYANRNSKIFSRYERYRNEEYAKFIIDLERAITSEATTNGN